LIQPIHERNKMQHKRRTVSWYEWGNIFFI